MSSNKFKYSTLLCKSSVRTKQSVISVALKTPLEMTLRICIYCTKRHFCIDPMTILVSHQAVPSHFTTKLRPWWYLTDYGRSEAYSKLKSSRDWVLTNDEYFFFICDNGNLSDSWRWSGWLKIWFPVVENSTSWKPYGRRSCRTRNFLKWYLNILIVTSSIRNKFFERSETTGRKGAGYHIKN